MSDSTMQDKVAIVTGGGDGLGRVLAKLFTERGVSVVVADIEPDSGQATVDAICASGGRARFVRTDVSDEKQVKCLVDVASEEFGGLDYAVNNAGIEGEVLPLIEQTGAALKRILAVNLEGVFYGLKYQIPAMLFRGGGAIVNIASIAGLRGHPGLAPYVASKHGVVGLTKTAAIEYGSKGIRVNSLCPGGILTPQLERYLAAAPDLRASIIDGNPMRRLAETEEMAKAALWLCSDEASYVNGHDLVVDGGKIASDV